VVSLSDPVIAYCGPAVLPGDVWTRWNLDPWLLAGLVLLALALARRWSRDGRTGWAAIALPLIVVVFVSPLCALSSALFAARALHHLLLIAAIAPLLALAFPQRRRGPLPLSALVAAQAIVLWFWHVPQAYVWGLATVPAYWLMQGSLFGSAWLLWRAILAPTAWPGPALVALAATVGQMGLLGALLVFAPQPLYAVHFATTWPWGLSPLADQELAGLLMWVPAVLPYLGAGLWIAWSSLRPGEPAL
jgi:putative membrane protein